jgi:hypothetical protein
MRILALAVTASLTLIIPKPATGAESTAQACTNLGALRVASAANVPVVVVPCATKVLAQPVVGNVSGYYGQVLLSTTGEGSYRVSSDFGSSLRRYFGVADKFDAVVSIELWRRGALLYQRPLFTASVSDSDGTTITANTVNASETEISPYFLLDTNTGSLQAKISISIVNRRSGQVVETLKKGVDAAAALGGHGWLVTALNTDAFVIAASRAEATLHQYYSYNLGVGSETDLGFGEKAYKSIRYSVTIPGQKAADPPAKVEATISLRTRTSLITEKMIINTTLPDMNKGAETMDPWANRILLGDTRTLGAYIEEGTPRRLSDLNVVDQETPDTEVARKEQIEAACASLKRAISEAPVRLSDSDKLLVLYDELRRRKVFRIYRATDLSCTSGLIEEWKSLGIVAPEPIGRVSFPIPDQDRTARMKLLATYWGFTNSDDRAKALPSNFTATVRLTAPADFLPGLPSSAPVDSSGYSTWDIDPKHLAKLHRQCFGNIKPTSTGEPGATAFATFAGNDALIYLIKAYFVDNATWGNEGPRVKAISIAAATDQDKIVYNHPEPNGCLGARPPGEQAALTAP